jgi:WD40 repeat protein
VSPAQPSPALLAAIQAEGRSLEERLRHIRRYGRTSLRYTELGTVSSGAMGEVVRARDESLQRELALKVVPIAAPPGKDPEAHERMLHRLLDEALITAHLDHPGIVPIHERTVDEARGMVLFSMSLVRGLTLARVFELVRAGKEGWTLHRTLGVLHQVCETVAFAHERGVIHRDLKPENVMVGQFGETYVMDWGLALVLGRQEDSVVGTPAYMAPEQAAGRHAEIGPQADVYSLGAILYELLGGAHPHHHSIEEGRAPEELIGRRPRPTRELARNLPPELAAICEKAMAPSLQRRYTTAKALARDLQAWLEGRVVAAYETGTWARLRKWRARNKKLATALAALGLVLLALPLQQYGRLRVVEAKNDDIRYENYVANLSAANLGIRALELEDAQRRLAQCTEELRDWEWRHLRLRSDASVGRLDDAGEVRSLAIDPRGEFLALGTEHGELELCAPDGRGPVHVLAALGTPVTAVAFSRDGERLAAVTEGGVVSLWNPVDEMQLWQRTCEAESGSVAISPTGERIVTGGPAGIRWWDAQSSRLVAQVATESVWALAFDPATGRLLSGHLSGRLRVWDGTSHELLEQVALGGRVRTLATHPLGAWVAVAREKEIALLDLERLERLATLAGHGLEVTSLAVTPRGDRILSGSSDSTVRVWDAPSGEELCAFLGHGDMVNAVAWLPDGKRFASASEDDTCRFWSLDARPEIVLEGHGASVTSLAFRADGARLLSASTDGTLRVWRADTGELLETIAVEREVASVVYRARDEIVLGPWDSLPRVGRPSSSSEWGELGFGARPPSRDAFAASLIFCGPTEDLFARLPNDLLVRWTAGTSEPAFVVPSPISSVGTFDVDPSGKWLAVGSTEQGVVLLDARTGAPLRTLLGPGNDVTIVAFGPHSDVLAVGRQTGTIRILPLAPGAESRLFLGHERVVNALAFDPSGRRLVSGAEDGTIRVWDLARRAPSEPGTAERMLLTLRGHAKGITALAFRPGGDTLASASKDGTVRLWRTPDSDAEPR